MPTFFFFFEKDGSRTVVPGVSTMYRNRKKVNEANTKQQKKREKLPMKKKNKRNTNKSNTGLRQKEAIKGLKYTNI